MEKYNIAVVTDDGETISQHFGRAQYYEVLHIENNAVVHRERREKLNHSHFAHHDHHYAGGQHGFDEESRKKHIGMAETISDCRFLLARGMGAGAYDSLLQVNIQPIVTDIQKIDDAINAVINDTIINHKEKLH
jgi:predicted Fe-Mo cluster-binding NifX family protein